jgi:hypothetical protein
MFPSDLNNAYAYEVERRKDEMRNAAKDRFGREFPKRRRVVILPMAFVSIIALILTIFIGH